MRERQTGTRERRGRGIGRREGATVQGRPWGHRHRGEGEGGEGRGGKRGELTVQCS